MHIHTNNNKGYGRKLWKEMDMLMALMVVMASQKH